MELHGGCVSSRPLSFLGSEHDEAVPVQGQDQENSALLVIQDSLVHQSIPTFIGTLRPGNQSARCLLSHFISSKQQSVRSPTCE